MNILTLIRSKYTPHGTFGTLFDVDDKPICNTLELAWRGNQPNISCISEGIYKVEPYSSNKFKDVFSLKDVMGRSSILIHAGNTTNDIQGCILVGQRFGTLHGLPAVLGSRNALNQLKKVDFNGVWIKS